MTARSYRWIGLPVLAAAAVSTTTHAAEIKLTGMLRDFQKSHADFDVPAMVNGHFVQNARVTLSPDNRPVFQPGLGFRVLSPWTNQAGDPIAPQLFMSMAPPCLPVMDSAGSQGFPGDGLISSSNTFNEWFRDVPGVNQSVPYMITLKQNGAGVYQYVDDAFNPIDGRMFGNEGESNNNNFTYHIRATFTYKECWAQFMEMEGGDGAWMFIDGRLVLDLGGVQTGDRQRVELDRLNLTDDEPYIVEIFYAQRNPTSSVFHLRSSVELESLDMPTTASAMFD